MLNFIPALLLLLASSPFGSSSGEALARIDSGTHVARTAKLARELELAGLTAAQAVLVLASCEERPTIKIEVASPQSAIRDERDPFLSEGLSRNVRFRDGPVA